MSIRMLDFTPHFLSEAGQHKDGFPPQNIAGLLIIKQFLNVRKWWNWQTHHLEGVAPKGVGVQIPPSAPSR